MLSRFSIVVVEDDDTIRELVKMTLAMAGFTHVQGVARGDDALKVCCETNPDVVILDLMLPGLDGMTVCRRLREEKGNRLGIVMLTAKGETEDIVAGLDAGADDYVVKPFSRSELIARVKSVLRRLENVGSNVESKALSFCGLVVDPVASSVMLADKTLSLTRTEFAMLEKFVSRPGRVYTRAQLSDVLAPSSGGERTVDVQIVGLRKKLGSWAEHIETVRGIGYRVR